MVKLKRVYEDPSSADGYRILVDRLWPRGISKEHAQLDLWLKDVAPSPDLRRWFGHDPGKWNEFRDRYNHELDENPALEELKQLTKAHSTVTLVYAAADPDHAHALVIQERLR